MLLPDARRTGGGGATDGLGDCLRAAVGAHEGRRETMAMGASWFPEDAQTMAMGVSGGAQRAVAVARRCVGIKCPELEAKGRRKCADPAPEGPGRRGKLRKGKAGLAGGG